VRFSSYIDYQKEGTSGLMFSIEIIEFGPHDGVEQGDSHGENGDGHKLEMLNLGEKRRRVVRLKLNPNSHYFS
jgi:hypothetical protein